MSCRRQLLVIFRCVGRIYAKFVRRRQSRDLFVLLRLREQMAGRDLEQSPTPPCCTAWSTPLTMFFGGDVRHVMDDHRSSSHRYWRLYGRPAEWAPPFAQPNGMEKEERDADVKWPDSRSGQSSRRRRAASPS